MHQAFLSLSHDQSLARKAVLVQLAPFPCADHFLCKAGHVASCTKTPFGMPEALAICPVLILWPGAKGDFERPSDKNGVYSSFALGRPTSSWDPPLPM